MEKPFYDMRFYPEEYFEEPKTYDYAFHKEVILGKLWNMSKDEIMGYITEHLIFHDEDEVWYVDIEDLDWED